VTESEGDLPIEHLNRCKLRDNLLYADIFNDDGSHRAVWRCHKREGHDGPCSSHNDCGVMNSGRVVCGLLPGHSGPHAWETRITAGAVPQQEPQESVQDWVIREARAIAGPRTHLQDSEALIQFGLRVAAYATGANR
jgi:hypothetical protein